MQINISSHSLWSFKITFAIVIKKLFVNDKINKFKCRISKHYILQHDLIYSVIKFNTKYEDETYSVIPTLWLK